MNGVLWLFQAVVAIVFFNFVKNEVFAYETVKAKMD